MATGNNIKAIARRTQSELGVKYTTALRAAQTAPLPQSLAESKASKDPQTDPTLLHIIASRPLTGIEDGFNQEDAAANPSTPAETLRWLADGPADGDTWVQDKLLTNPSTPVDILRRFMLRDEHSREQLAKNPAAGDRLVLEVIAAEPQNHNVEYWASKNPGLSAKTRAYVDGVRTTESWRRYVAEVTADELRKTFVGWLKLQENRYDPIGDLARDVAVDADFPSGEAWDAIDSHLGGSAAHPAAVDAWAEYNDQ